MGIGAKLKEIKVALQPVKGMRDLLGDEWRTFQWIQSEFQRVSESYGFSAMETPILEPSALFQRGLGETSDIVSKEMYTFTDAGGESLTLRPEGTAPIARAFLSHSLQRELPLKWTYSGPMFRRERPQKGRYRQFYQIGCEFLGVENPVADVETMAMGHQLLSSLGVNEKVQLELNSIGDQQSRERYREKLLNYLSKYENELSPESQNRLKTNPLRILDSKQEQDQKIIATAPAIRDHLTTSSATHYDRVIELLSELNIPFQESPRLVRGLDYYCETVFEFTTSHLGSQNAVLSGGRYDQLIEMMGGSKTPGVGWAAGVDRLSLLIGSKSRAPRPIVFIPLDESHENESLRHCQECRDIGITAEMTYSGNLSKRLKRANKLNAWAAVIIGGEEATRGQVSLRFLDQGKQESVTKGELLAVLKQHANS